VRPDLNAEILQGAVLPLVVGIGDVESKFAP